MIELSVIVVGNNEMWHARTVQDLIDHTGEQTEIIAVLDGGVWPAEPIPKHPRVQVIYLPDTVGQREATNIGARLSKAKFVAKADGHCAFDDDFDTKMIDFFKEQGDNIVAVPVMRNLHAFNWKCYKCGSKWYQGPTPTRCMLQTDMKVEPNTKCDETRKFKRKMVWLPRKGTYSVAYCFDSGRPSKEKHNNEPPHFQYHAEYKTRPEYIEGKAKGCTETMSLQGSFFMSTLENYWKLKLSDGGVGSWGNQGIEVAGKM